jgi:transposase
MTTVLKQIIGIDVAQDELVVTVGRLSSDLKPQLYAYKLFKNNPKGFTSLTKWVDKLTDQAIPKRFVLEATGVYHEQFAYYLADNGLTVSVILPSKISSYFRTLDVKTITDKTSSETICMFGLEKNLSDWQAPEPIYRELRQLTRERQQIVDECTVAKNQLHAEQAGANPNPGTIKRIKGRIALLQKQKKEIKLEIDQLINNEEGLKACIQFLCSIPGIGLLTAVTILAETSGFALINNKRQLTSYAGLDVQQKQSGTSVQSKPRISKKGNKNLRRAMHLPALTAIKHNVQFKNIFIRIVSRNGIKMKGVVAVQRKLLELCYTLFKKQEKYKFNSNTHMQLDAA